ncbi:MAG: hypothetical protein BGO41_07920 [Clostridiales bacterium 38-18]|nr:MAG: hypothetical protein BGO41_07920 [Clostridiales bacterium 38-18]
MFTLVLFEIRKRIKPVFWMALAIVSMVAISMQFYPTITENMALLDGFLSTGMMDQVLGAFNVEVAAMKSLVGFFNTYCTMWVMMVGGVFFAYVGADLLSKEERLGTIDYLALKPYSRVKIYLSKWLSLQALILTFFIVITGVGWGSLKLQESRAPWVVDENALTEERIEQVVKQGDSISANIVIDEAIFSAYTNEMLLKSVTEQQESVDTAGIDAKGLIDAFGDQMQDPEALFDAMLSDPDQYLALFKNFVTDDALSQLDRASFIEAVHEEQDKYENLSQDFITTDHILRDYFKTNPEFFLNLVIEQNLTKDLFNAVPEMKKVIMQFNALALLRALFNMYMVTVVLGTLGMFMGGALKNNAAAPQQALGLTLIFYFMNSILGYEVNLSWIKWLTPFGYAETSGDEINLARLMLLFFVAMLFFIVGGIRYKKRDFSSRV